ncbi:hypothetical protein [Nostoc sp. 'Peltigera malacea cyanobiont' DB3992]|uniref:hypothetical protein n=1 Tax=Nostoc sp. 'Peltigera malacea cyanobiont' DB3992 TaxID=1206980 RepID=UPI000C03906A|nr:hypothetical protein [Nostoc sp. 'Peltigera malacea cyanobiont' DB3992]PHM09466.1 hypothetical protein CK516_14490 [Nostoc sp. 'Peltigera malacea cyanobiont' DB3992]
MNYKLWTASLISGIALIYGASKLNSRQLTLIAIGALPSTIVAHIVADTRITKSERKNYDVLLKLQEELTDCQSLQKSTEANLNKAVNNEALLKSELSKLKNQYSSLVTDADNLTEELNKQLGEYRYELGQKNIRLNEVIGQLGINDAENSELKNQIEILQTEIEVWIDTFNSKLSNETKSAVDKVKITLISQLFNDFKAIGLRHESGIKELKQWTEIVSQRLNDKTTVMMSVTDSYVDNLDSLNHQRLEELTIANERINSLIGQIRLLEIQIDGDLVEPQYFDASYDINAQIGNAIAKEFFKVTQIPLVVKGFLVKPDGAIDIGYGYARNNKPETIVNTLKQLSNQLTKSLGIYKITTVKKLEITDCIQLTFRREPAIKDDDIKSLVGTPEEFINYVVNHPIRYRLIANPGQGKTPSLAVMVSEILKAGCKKGNVSRGKKVDNTLVTVSYPGVESSLKDTDYPLDLFLKYGNETAANKSFGDAINDWKFRKQYPNYADKFFKLWIWEELDNTLDSATDALDSSEKLKKILKQGGHSNIGFIVSGQSVMTKQIKGFTNDDRALFTEIIIGISKIRKYIATYGSKAANIQRLLNNLDDIEEYIDAKNSKITDEARLLRLALVMDDRSPKLYFLPNLDCAVFDSKEVEITENTAKVMRESLMSGTTDIEAISIGLTSSDTIPFTTIQALPTSDINASCPHCGSSKLTLQSDRRYYCLDCKKRMASSKVIYKSI